MTPSNPPESTYRADPPCLHRLIIEKSGEILSETRSRRIAVHRPLREHFQNNRFEISGNFGVNRPRRRGFGPRDLVDKLGCAATIKRGAQGQEFVQSSAETKDVGTPVNDTGASLLGAHIPRGSKQTIMLCKARVSDPSGQAEVGDPDCPLGVDQQVGRLDVAVDDSLVVGVSECLGSLKADLGNPTIE
jgi:hypothetical protein